MLPGDLLQWAGLNCHITRGGGVLDCAVAFTRLLRGCPTLVMRNACKQ